ncbi:hypothetical protein F8M41_019378 [Gigaspora margarita]|uniref:Uncharacterized protein n=1 Tax=Gigaspora margarita TaxID=4874 RepID=A0A8H4B5F8_GIGMA|nr:hypothetical protein F8M41_019378 [Gigaspora margarita]
MNDKNQSKAIHALLQNGSTIYIDLNMKHYLLLYDNDNNQSTGIVLDWSKKVVKDIIFAANKTVENSNIVTMSDVHLSSFIISSQDIGTVNWIVCNLPQDESSILDYLAYDTFVLSDNSSLSFIFPTTDGIYGFITTELSYEINSILNVPVPIVSIYYMSLTPLTHQISKKFLLHYARNVDFLSSGSVIGVHALYFQLMYTNYSVQYNCQSLFYGGAVITSWSVEDNIIKKKKLAA